MSSAISVSYTHLFGERECGRELDNVGLIMPEPEICTGQKTETEVIMYDDLAEGSLLETCNVSFPIDAADDVGLSIKSIAFDGDVSILDAVSYTHLWFLRNNPHGS